MTQNKRLIEKRQLCNTHLDGGGADFEIIRRIWYVVSCKINTIFANKNTYLRFEREKKNTGTIDR